jgi:hypothetical protein
MCLRYLAVACAVLACASLYALMPRPMQLVEPLAGEVAQEAAAIDFDTLHAEAAAALQALRQSQERRVAMAAPDAL